MLGLTISYHLGFAIMFNDVKQTYEIKKLKKFEHLWWCNPLVGTWIIIMKVWGSIPYTYVHV
jgi:hypothetical protein